tara:strand:- start:6868 stop:7905 length:1038 start_codon:yes stop_codon:yes gene_type:complete
MNTVIIAAGGTGGHVFPAEQIALDFKNKGWTPIWLGKNNSLESQVCNKLKMRMIHIHVCALRGVKNRVYPILLLIQAIMKLLFLFTLKRPKAIILMGGYVSLPAGIVASILRIPLFIHEQNSIMGGANKLLYPMVKKGFCAYPDLAEKMNNLICHGNPIRFTHPVRSSDRKKRCHLLIIGGSQGAVQLNELMVSLYRLKSSHKFKIWHMTGIEHYQKLGSQCKDFSQIYRISAFHHEMDEAYEWADIVISRSGAMTLSELAYFGKPAILLPYPHAADHHQQSNAEYFIRHGAAQLCPENATDLVKLINSMIRTKSIYNQYVENMKSLSSDNAGLKIVETIIPLVT